ncbi:DUF6207 family protein [Streptomyces violaceus]|uniref:DUF6207 family protein n=1 Tax=Streptomyces violaceus TaxID=1936 RepID=A0ABY9UKW2_STRVL|nr:DUF6207 family protein [Streptomyces janthinus]WND23506.1 DUF6207 family protein [Streptomyces janthinus]
MKPVNEAHVAQPGLAVVEVAAAGELTAFAIQDAFTVGDGYFFVPPPGDSWLDALARA